MTPPAEAASHPNAVCFTFDVEWAPQAVIDDVRSMLDERGIVGTFFVTHAGVDVPGHERGLHPNFRRSGDVYKMLKDPHLRTDAEIYRHVIETTLSFAPEAKGVRSHSLMYESALLGIYEQVGIEYDSTYRLELIDDIRPFRKQHGVVEIPAYYADYFDLTDGVTGFRAAALHLESPGLKVLDFHPNLIYINAPDLASYEAIRPFYRDSERLAEARFNGRGTRTLFIEALDAAARGRLPVSTLGDINRVWRMHRPKA